jgi:hypothetical protein
MSFLEGCHQFLDLLHFFITLQEYLPLDQSHLPSCHHLICLSGIRLDYLCRFSILSHAMLNLINPEVFKDRVKYASRFQSADPFPYLAIDRFFEPAFCEQLIAEFPPFERGKNLNENGLPGGKSTVEDIRSLGDAYGLADDLFQSPEFSSFMSDLTGIRDLLYDRMYVGGGTHENRPGQELDPHVDFNYHPVEGWHRRLNLIVYLNREWDEEWGGSIEFHEDPWRPPEQNRIRRVVPLANRAIVFETSERSWHGFEVIRQPANHPPISRKSLAIYMYTKDRPPAETAPAHATVYVERPLPFVLRPGDSTGTQGSRVRKALMRRVQHIDRLRERERVFTQRIIEQFRKLFSSAEPLDQQDIETLEGVFRREDALLKLLYDREKEFSRDIKWLQRRVGGREIRLPIIGAAKLAAAPTGYYPDEWCGPLLTFDLELSAPSKAVILRGRIPDRFPHGQALECTIREVSETAQFRPGDLNWTVPAVMAAGERASVRIRASASFCPARDDGSAKDKRELAYHLYAVEVV